MIIYFCDRAMNILGQASTELPAGYRVSDDLIDENAGRKINKLE